MSGTHIVFVTEGGPDVGLGHVSRCLAIARAARAEGARVSFLVPPEPRVAALLRSMPADVTAYSWPADAGGALEVLRGLRPDAIVVDSYKATPAFLGALRALASPVVAVDDTAERALPVDVVVNGSIAAESLPYARTSETTLLLGPRYAPLDPDYADLPERCLADRLGRVLVTLGGGLNAADVAAAVRAADAVLIDGVVEVAAGSFAAGTGALDDVARAARNRVVVHRDRFGLRDMMLAADLAVCGAGMTLYELAATGTPAITVCMADNQWPNAEAFARAGAAPTAGRAGDPGLGAAVEAALRRLAPAPARAEVAARAHRLVDGRGAARVAKWVPRTRAGAEVTMAAPKIRIGERWVGDGEPCFVIAEAGANHNRDLGMGKALIDVAADAGADAVKFQTYSAETLYSKRTPRFSYLEGVSAQDTWDLIKAIELPREWQADLSAHARARGIPFLSTPFDYKAVDELAALGVPAYKIASFEIVDLPLIGYTAARGRPMILSTGLATYEDIADAVGACAAAGNRDIALLQCASLYPAPPARMNLRAMATMRAAFNVPVGLSDHSLGIHVAVAAAGLGASIVEKHFTLDRTLPGPDHPFAIEPGELGQMVRQIREVEAALGDGLKLGPAPEELEMHEKARRSLIAARDIPKGTAIERSMIVIKRPGFGIRPKLIDLVVGRVARVDIAEDAVLTWDLL